MAITYDNKNDYIVVAVKSVEGGKVSGGNVSILKGESITLTATPDENYEFLGWEVSEGYSSSENPYTFTPSGNVYVTPLFLNTAGEDYTISWGWWGAHSASWKNQGLYPSPYKYGKAISATFISNLYDSEGAPKYAVVIDKTNNTSELIKPSSQWEEGNYYWSVFNFTVTGNITVILHWEDLKEITIQTSCNYDDVKVVPIPTSGYRGTLFKAAIYNPNGRKISSIEINNESVEIAPVVYGTIGTSERPYAATVVVVAEALSTDTYNITVSTDGNGDVSLPHENPYNDGEWVVLRATPAAGYEFESYEIDGEIITSINYVFQIHADTNVKVTFKKNSEVASTISVIADPVEGGKPTVNGVLGSRELNKGTKCTIAGKANSGYSVIGYYDGDTLLGTGNEYSFTVGDDKTITVKYKELPVDPYSPGGDSGTGGGDGSFDDTSDNPTSDNTTPSIPSSMMSIFVPTSTQFEELGNYLYGESAKGFFTNLVDTIGSLGTVKVSDYTINCYQCPVAITADGSKALELGWYPTSLTMNYTNKMGVIVSLGTVEVPNYYGNALDYKSRIQIYLPYIGYQDLDPAEVIGKTLNLSYKIEFITGDCVATITIDNKPMYQFKGNVAYRIPLSQDNFSDVIQQGISIGTNAIGAGIAVGSAMTPLRTGTSMYNWAIEQANQGVIYPAQLETGSQLMNEGVENLPTAQMSLEQLQNKLSTAINTGTSVPHGSSAGGNTGWYMNQRPFIIIVRPRLSMPANYGHYHGYPSNITSRIGDLSGYTEFSAVHLEGLTATSNELSELEKVLKGGIRIGN